LLLNLEEDLELRPVAEPLLAPPASGEFQLVFSSEDPRYGGSGTGAPYQDGLWRLPARSALVFVAPPEEREERR
jgi:maltooligosyltrehalose trehalohydrolase